MCSSLVPSMILPEMEQGGFSMILLMDHTHLPIRYRTHPRPKQSTFGVCSCRWIFFLSWEDQLEHAWMQMKKEEECPLQTQRRILHLFGHLQYGSHERTMILFASFPLVLVVAVLGAFARQFHEQIGARHHVVAMPPSRLDFSCCFPEVDDEASLRPLPCIIVRQLPESLGKLLPSLLCPRRCH